MITLSFSNKANAFSGYSNPLYQRCRGTPAPGCCSPGGPPAIAAQLFTDMAASYYTNTLWPNIEGALKKFADESRKSILFSSSAKGAMIDAQIFNQTLTSLATQTTKTLVTQTPSNQICRFGTVSKSLAQSEDKSRLVQLGLAKQMMQRQLMAKNMSSGFDDGVGSNLGRTSDKIARFDLYKRVFCDPKDSNATLGDGWCTASTDDRRNKDIEIVRSLYSPLTIKIDFSPAEIGNVTPDEQNIFALANNLFAHDLPVNMDQPNFEVMSRDTSDEAVKKKEQFMDYRSLTAKRGVAQNSFAALASMKAEGSNGSTTYLKELIADLGLDATAQGALLGQKPSYNAQMELLTRKIYQSPSFYANLMESNSNITRQQTAMEGIGLMQDRDIFESLRRSEMVLSTLLEMYVMQEQDRFKDKGTK